MDGASDRGRKQLAAWADRMETVTLPTFIRHQESSCFVIVKSSYLFFDPGLSRFSVTVYILHVNSAFQFIDIAS